MPLSVRALLARAALASAALFLALGAFGSAAALAEQYKVGALVIEESFARPSMARNGAAYLTIANTAHQPDRLIRVASTRASKVEMHTMSMDGDIMRMRELAGIEVPPQGRVAMEPGQGLHIMLIGLKGPLNDGEKFPMTLQFERAGKVEVTVEVRKPPSAKPGAKKS